MGYRAENGLYKRGFAASIGADYAQKIIVRNGQSDLLQGLVILLSNAYVV